MRNEGTISPGPIRGRDLTSLAGRAPKTIDAERVCSAEGCATVLSRYNVRSRCWQHDEPERFVLRVRDRKGAIEAA